jgi:hypothetical protein
MYMPDVIFGFVGIILISVMVGYLALIQKNFRDRQKVALTMFFLRDEGASYFKVLAISMIVYSVSMFAVGIEFIYSNYLLEVFTRVAILVSMAGLLYFVRGVKIITGQDKEQVKE